MKNNTLNTAHISELLYQALETEKGGVQIYETALKCVVNPDLREEWEKYLESKRQLEHTRTQIELLTAQLKKVENV